MKRQNPKVPAWLAEEYAASIRELATIGLRQLPAVHEKDTSRAILSVIALASGLRLHAKILIEYTEDELLGFITDSSTS